MSSQLLTGDNGENDFDFDEWISIHNLDEVKQLFIKHGATTKQSLTLISDQFKALMVDKELFTKSHMIPSIMDAMNKTQKVIKVIISENEQLVINNIKQNLQTLQKLEQEIDNLKDAHSKIQLQTKNEQIKQIEDIQKKITKLFQNIFDAFNIKKETLLKKAEILKNNITQNEEDEKFNSFYKSQQINETRNYLEEQLKNCNNLTSNNNNIKQRKNKIINIGKYTDQKFNEISKSLNNIIYNTNKSMNQNKSTTGNIALKINDKSYQAIMSNINDIITIIDATDKWDPNFKHSSWTIDQNVIKRTRVSGSSAFLQNIVDTGRHIWTFKINNVGDSNNLRFGIWNNKHKPVFDYHIGHNNVNTAYVFCGYAGKLCKHNSAGYNPVDNYGIVCGQNTIIEMDLDFSALSLSFTINDVDYGKAFEIEPAAYRAAVSGGYNHTVIELLQYQNKS
eukprot:305922_1